MTGDTRGSISSGSGEGPEPAGSTLTTSTTGEPGAPLGSKPRSLRFTWSMKTTSSMEPAEMMKEIRKVG